MNLPHIVVINGPNLNLLGSREPEKYGTQTLQDIQKDCEQLASELNVSVDFYQSNSEGAIVDRVHQAKADQSSFIIINAGAYTHTSIAIRDAILGVNLPAIEVHLSNVHARESFRQHSYLADIVVGSVVGLGALGYQHAIRSAASHLNIQHAS